MHDNFVPGLRALKDLRFKGRLGLNIGFRTYTSDSNMLPEKSLRSQCRVVCLRKGLWNLSHVDSALVQGNNDRVLGSLDITAWARRQRARASIAETSSRRTCQVASVSWAMLHGIWTPLLSVHEAQDEA